MFGMKTALRQSLFLRCLALLICLGVTGDVVVDLVFEQPDLYAAAQESDTAEEADNAAEHILLPSQQSEDSLGTASHVGILMGADVWFTSYAPSAAIVGRTVSHEKPPRSILGPLLLPLRI